MSITEIDVSGRWGNIHNKTEIALFRLAVFDVLTVQDHFILCIVHSKPVCLRKQAL